MNRSSFILGLALLVVAATLAVTITLRNAPRDVGAVDEGRPAGRGRIHDCAPSGMDSGPSGETPRAPVAAARNPQARAVYRVVIPAGQLALLRADQRNEWIGRAAEVEREARARLGRMTAEFDLSGEQRRRMFPLLVRSTAGFDPRMQVGGSFLEIGPVSLAGDEVHGLLDAEQQARLADDEVERQIWWQEIFSRLERELLDATDGGQPAGEPAPPLPGYDPGDDPAGSGGEREAPARRGGGNLNDLLGT